MMPGDVLVLKSAAVPRQAREFHWGRTMKSTAGASRGWLGAFALGLCLFTGCQTWMGGMTLPSGHYLEHPPQYFPPSPAFPLSRELAAQETINAAPLTAG